MCGIGVTLCSGECGHSPSESDCDQHFDQRTLQLIRRRGPDHWGEAVVEVVPPQRKDNQTIRVELCASVLSLSGPATCSQPASNSNGSLCFNGEIYGGLEIPAESPDTIALRDALAETSSADGVAAIFSRLWGPWAFVYVCKRSNRVYFGRDIFGRRCLLIRKTGCGFQLASVAYDHSRSRPEASWEEIPAQGIYVYDIVHSSWQLIQWDRTPSGSAEHSVAPCTALKDVPLAKQRLTCPIGKPFRHSPPQLQRSSAATTRIDYDNLLNLYEDTIVEFEATLTRSIVRRVTTISRRYTGTPVGILFSGGIDSTIIAAIAMKSFPDLAFELINVAFEHKNEQGTPSFETPDRRTSVEALHELERVGIAASRTRLICVDVSYDELQRSREELHVARLVQPMNTVLDDSLGFALWFAARGQGRDHRTSNSYESQARVLLLGMGADEQLGGYSRHAASFKDGSWSSLAKCIAMDIDRISWRNLGRDDRVVADLGKESRIPFLDEEVVSFLNDLALDIKMRLNLARGLGDKLILRLLAYRMGLRETATRPKRALQFGSRIAHADPKKSKGHMVCNRFE